MSKRYIACPGTERPVGLSPTAAVAIAYLNGAGEVCTMWTVAMRVYWPRVFAYHRIDEPVAIEPGESFYIDPGVKIRWTEEI